MRRGSRGFSLIEVMVALLVLVAGLLPVAYGVAAGIALARRGTARSHLAVVLMGRLAELQQGTADRTGCGRLSSESRGTGGVSESWTVAGSDSIRSVLIRVSLPLPGGAVTDSALVKVPCA